jgi:hypothetical protein
MKLSSKKKLRWTSQVNLLLQLIGCFWLGSTGNISAATLIVPPELAAQDGNLAAQFQFNNERLQQVYSSAYFSSIGSVIDLSEVRLRVDVNARAFSSTPDIELRISTTFEDPDRLSTVFASNVGADEVVALPRTRLAWNGNPGTAFSVVIPLPNHFQYDPSKGNLLLDFSIFDLGQASGLFDALDKPTDGLSVMGGVIGNSQGQTDSGAFVTSFTYITVPEPPVTALLFFGGVLASVRPRVSRRRPVLLSRLATMVSCCLVFAEPRSHGATIVVPPELANANGDLSGGFQFDGERFQQVYGNAYFSSIGSTIELTEVRFRVDPNDRAFSSTPELELRVSTTLRNPDQLSNLFASNVGADETVVLPRTQLAWSGVPGTSFTVVIPLPNHFQYDPSRGNLLLDFRIFQIGQTPPGFDVTQAPDQLSNVSGLMTRSDGVQDTAAFVTSFTYLIVPEPCVISLLILSGLIFPKRNHGVAVLALWRLWLVQ